MRPVLVRINKKTVIPSPNPKYEYRIIFQHIHKIDYLESEHYFKHIGNLNIGLQIETDAQFAKYLLDNFKTGKYTINVWKKGRQAFSFFYFDCEKRNVFKQIRKKRTKEEEEVEQTVRKIKHKTSEMKSDISDQKKGELKKEIEVLKEEVAYDTDYNKELKSLDTKRVALFKNVKPLYKEHEYEDYGDDESDYTKKYDSSIW